MPGRVRRADAQHDDTLETLADVLDQHLPAVFTAAQQTTASHRKHINTLHGVFLRCAKVTTLSSDGRYTRLSGEKAFGEKFREMATHPLGLKKGTDQADRVIKFIAGFVGFAIEHDFKQREANGEQDDDDVDDGPASRLVAQVLAFLLRGFQAKNKIARYRCVQLVALMINSLGEIDDESYKTLKSALLERVRDKEASVRQHAVVALSKLQDADEEVDNDSEDDSDDETAKGDKKSVTAVLVDVLNHDPAAEVRRAALFNLIPSPETLPSLLRRTLDVDTTNRRLAFAHVLAEIPPRSLSLKQRQTVLGRGLRDREEAVRKAAKKLVAKWAELLAQSGQDAEGIIEAFVGLFDVYTTDGKAIAEKALEGLFELRPDLIESIDLSDESFFQTLTPATALLVRTYIDHLRAQESSRLADVEPVATALAFYLQAAWTQLVVSLDADERDTDTERQLQFIVGELVNVAINLDYGDEIGRRKMFELMREMLQNPLLPPTLIPLCLDVLLKGTSERDFMRIVVEIVQSLRRDSHLVTSDSELGEQDEDDDIDGGAHAGSDSDRDGEPGDRDAAKKKASARRKSAVQTPQQAARRKDLDLRCLFVVKALLERVMSALQENSMLHGLVAELIVPAVKTKDYEVRAQGLICLGLCCLLDKSMALDSFQLLARQSESTEGELQVKVLQTLFDLIVLHGVNFGEERGFGSNLIIGFLGSSLDQEDPTAAATVVVGIAKLLLSGMVTDEEILSRLVLLYFASETADNPELRQCLSYFFPVYCYSNPENQRRLASVMVKSLDVLRTVYEDLKDKSTMVTPLQIGSQLVDWTDPQKVIDSEGIEPDETVQVDLAIRTLKALYRAEEKEARKLWCQLLPKLHVPEEADDSKIRSIMYLIDELKDNRPIADTVSKNALNRFQTALHKSFDERLDGLDEGARAAVEQSDDVKAIKAWVRKVEREESDESESAEEEDDDDDDAESEEGEEEESDASEEETEV
ncbi:hypothetical protein BMF94_6138 [Rhodotorula taiwanensis]|uniref:Nuclear condensin complex subunit 3 C-terminal domain-containing protein n=1 Tax=Rhodotorula taiwanensis TaxID=741276 RepID=A0A2S5B1S4_9BASI|nr:hypothetical protein BMF94_6138 [Rhodotorula taiwanensis]